MGLKPLELLSFLIRQLKLTVMEKGSAMNDRKWIMNSKHPFSLVKATGKEILPMDK